MNEQAKNNGERENEEEPMIFGVHLDDSGMRLNRRDFVSAIAVTATAAGIVGCDDDGKKDSEPPFSTGTLSPGKRGKVYRLGGDEFTVDCDDPIPEGGKCACDCVTAPSSGTVKPGTTGIEYTVNSVRYTLPCGSKLPPGAICTCNCVTVPAARSTPKTTPKTTTRTTPRTYTTYYWYPN